MRLPAVLPCLAIAVWLVAASASAQTADEFAAAAKAAAALPRLHSLVVSDRGEVVLEYHARGVSHALTRPLATDPGTSMQYSNGRAVWRSQACGGVLCAGRF